MGEYQRLTKEISKLKARRLKAEKISGARRELRELKYGKYLEPGRKIAGYIKKQATTQPRRRKGRKGKIDNDPLGLGDFKFNWRNPL